jgi:prepilin peptidase CpaA
MSALSAPLTVAGLLAAAAGLGWAASSDLTRYRIPNRACALVALGFALAAAAGPAGAAVGGLLTGFAVLAVGALLFARGSVGGGDVKLAAAVALWAGPHGFSDFAFVTSLSGAATAAVMLSPLRRALPQPPHDVASDFRQPMPFGVPLALGGAWLCALRLVPLLQGA